MSVNSRAKGCRGERELAGVIRDYGWDARRGQQFSGSPDSPDIVHSIPGLHIECKRTKRLNLYDALSQAKGDKADDEIPVVCHRRDRCEWVAILPLEDFLKIMREHEEFVPEDFNAENKSDDAGHIASDTA